MARAAHTCNDVYQVKTRLSSSQQKRYEESTAPSSTHKTAGLTMSWASMTTRQVQLSNKVVSWTRWLTRRLCQGAGSNENTQAPTAQTLLKVQRLNSRSPSTRSSTSLSRCSGRNPVCQQAYQQTMKIPVKGFRRSWRLSGQNIVDFPLIGGFRRTWRFPSFQHTGKMVDGNAESSKDSADAAGPDPGSGNSSEWWTLQLCSRQRHWQVPSTRENPEGCRDETGAVQGDEPAIQKRMPNIQNVEITHAVTQGHECVLLDTHSW